MVFYRKYRPQTILDLDSKAVRETLSLVLSGDEVPHAFLFTGPKGLGKTSTARIVAKVVNCQRLASSKLASSSEKKKLDARRSTLDANVEPCNKCDQCVSITNGTNMDVIEIDAASNRGIDEIRDLKDKIRLAPLRASKKVYIIDEVHMLTTEAFNALLKTLEEPPDHAIFILCTTEPHKVPATILSRSFHIAFQKATTDELVRSFQRIAKGEHMTIEDDALREVAKISDGGFRDGTKIIEELALVAKGKKITKELVKSRYKIGSVTQGVTEILEYLVRRDTKKALHLVNELSSSGIDIKFFTQELIDTLHEALLVTVGVLDEKEKRLPLTASELKELLHLFTRAHADIKYAVLAQIPLELAIIEWTEGSLQDKNEEASEQGSRVKITKGDKNDVTIETTMTTVKTDMKMLRKTVGNIKKIKALYGENAVAEIKDKPSDNINTSSVSLMHYSSDTDTKEWVDHLWQNIIIETKAHNHTLAGVLRGCMVKSYDRKSLIIETLYTFHKERLSNAKTKAMLESIIKQLTGSPVSVSIELKKN